ncbi:MAG TPA: preprotein translocase subunit SecG [Chitinophagaceae bacterium]|jgi:preprotein translocase subunit SecG|nr:preprotein translocase subunit SecG [Chitinophagaceae bacterium]
MTLIFIILIILASVILGFIVLVQNPKGGGLTGSMAGLSNQFMGVKQTTDVLEKGTWLFAGIIGLLCLTSSFFISGKTTSTTIDATAPATQQTAPVNTLPTAPPANTPAPATNTPK